MAVYRWKSGAHVKGDSQKVGEVCERLDRKGDLTPQALVKEARKEKSPLHPLFEWDDATAAQKYREVQAGYIIRSIEVVATGGEQVRAFVSVTVEGGGKVYTDVEAALSEEPTRDEVLQTALAELRAFERKYKDLAELAGVIAAIRSVA